MNTLNGKKCLITGASSGLGLELTKLVIRQGAEVIMLCRNESKGKVIVEKLLAENPNARLHLEVADFTSLESVKRFTKDFKRKHQSLDMLINNAALMKDKTTKTVDGFESMFQVNYLAPFVLTNSLQPLLENGKSSQIVNITLPPDDLRLDFNKIQSPVDFKPMRHLLNTKLCLFLYSVELSDRLKKSNIKVFTGVPSNRPFKTSLGRELSFLMKVMMRMISVDVRKVAGNIMQIVEKDDIKQGFVFKGLKKINLHSYWTNTTIRNKLWQNTENILTNRI